MNNKLISMIIFISMLIFNYCGNGISKSPDENRPLKDLYTPHDLYNKILSLHQKSLISYGNLIHQLTNSNVIFLGEIHNSLKAHQYQHRILKSMYQNNKNIAIALEMFDRDVQPIIDQYLSGKISEKMFLKKSRPWPNYKDYRPLIHFAKEHHLKVIAMNIPMNIRRSIVYGGMKSLVQLQKKYKKYFAQKIPFNNRIYKKYFYNALPKGHPGSKKYKKLLYHFYLSAVAKDATMAESIGQFLDNNTGYQILSVNGRFHSDYGLAIPGMLKTYNKNISMKIISFHPIISQKKILMKSFYNGRKQADYIIFTDYTKSFH